MRKPLEALAFVSLFLLWSLSVVSIPIIPETCIICGRQEGADYSEHLRTLSVVDWAFDTVPDAHFSCFRKYDKETHNPDGGIR